MRFRLPFAAAPWSEWGDANLTANVQSSRANLDESERSGTPSREGEAIMFPAGARGVCPCQQRLEPPRIPAY